MSATGCVMLYLLLFFFTADFNNVISEEIPPSSNPSSGVGQCSDGERTCPSSKACYQNYQICDSYDDCGNFFDEIECPRSPEVCQHVLGNSSAFQDACTRSVVYVPAEEEYIVTDGLLHFPGPANNYFLLDAISFSTVDFPVGEFGYLRLVITPFSSVTSDSLEPVILVLSDAIEWTFNDGSYEILLRSPIRGNPSVIDMVRLEVSYVINSSPSATNPYLPPLYLSTTSFRMRYRFYYDQCASILSEGETGIPPIDQNSCLLAVKDYATYTNDAALQRVYCEPREWVQVAYDLYSECFELPLPMQPWQSLPSTSGPSTVPASTSPPMLAPFCDQVKEICPVSRGCFNQSQVCDSYDDCGTGFDESSCSSLSDEEGTTCQEVDQNASLFNSFCAEFRSFRDPFTSDDIQLIGLHLFAAPQGSRIHIESINVTTPAFTPNLSGDVYAMFSIAIIDQQRQTVNSTTLTAELRVTDIGVFRHILPLRVPLPVSSTDRIEVYIQRTLETGPPSPQNPYQGVSVRTGAVRLNFVNYRGEDCGSVSQTEQGPAWNLCLQSAWDFTKASERMFSMGLTCQPLERIHFISNMYNECFDEPSIVQISRNNSVVPGQEVSLICAARGTPVPTVRWLVPDDLIVFNHLFLSTTTNSSTITFTGEIANMQYRFECIAESYVGEKRAVRFVTILGNECVEKLELRDNFLASSDPNQSCPNVRAITQFDFYSSSLRAIAYSSPSNGYLFSIDLPWYLFSFSYGNTIAGLRISVIVDNFLSGPPSRRRKRYVVPILYERDYFDITQNGNDHVRIRFLDPVSITSQQIYISYESLESSQETFPPEEGPVTLRYLECPTVIDRINDTMCFTIYDQWREVEEELIELGCTRRTSPLFNLYQNCLGIKDEPLMELPLTIPEIKVDDNFTIRCPITGDLQSYWMKKTSREDVLPFVRQSPILQFEFFNSQNQGYYFCRGVGSNNQTLETEPVLLAYKASEFTTLGFSITYDRPYIDIDDPIFPYSSFDLLSPVRIALFRDSTIWQMLVGGGLGFGGDVPTIINTRNGSMIVDYQATFSNANGTDLIEEVTTALRDNLGSSDATPRDLILDSITVGSVSACPESVYVGSEGTFTFPSVGLGQISESVEHCPVYTGNTPVPRARRTCLGDFITQAYWADLVPSECFDENDNTNQVLDDIANAPISKDNVTEYSSDLAKVTNDTSSITADGLESIATSLENIVSVQESSMEVTVNVINTVNNVLQVSDEDFVIAIDAGAPTRILDSLEDQLTLFQTQGDGSNLTVVDDSIAVVALNIPRTTVQGGIGFGSQSVVGSGNNAYNEVLGENSTMVFFDLDAMPINEFEAVVSLPSGILDSISSGESMVPITFFVFQNSRLFQSGNQHNTLEPGRRQAVGSRIISATIEGFDVQNLPVGQEIETAFLELNVTDDDETVDNRSCVFWEKTIIGGQWSTRGCRREDLPEIDRIRCLCDHLTSFAVLLDVSGDINIFVLDILSMIGCGISSLCLVILLITFICFKKLRSSQPQRIHINLCLALLGLYLDFLVGIDLRYPTIGCVIAGFILHFFLLSSMAWMLVEAVYMYILFVNVHSGTVSKYIRTSSVLAWGSPLIVCIIIVCIDREFYLGDNTYCFVQPGPVLYYSVLLPEAAIVLINTIIFILVAYRLTCGRWTISANKSTGEDKRSETWRRLQNLVAFTLLLGLTWAFGFLAIGGARSIFNVLFLVFNSLQGLFIFIMFGLRLKSVRDEWLRFFRCQCCEDEKSRRSINYMKSRPLTGGKSSGQTESSSAGTHGSAFLLDGRGLSSTTSSQLP